MTAALREIVERMFAAVESKQVAAVLSHFADNAVVIDPHYPTPQMHGKPAIADGLQWAFTTLQQMRFTVLNFCAADDGRCVAVETATAHTLPGGRQLQFTQTFMVEIENGLITRLQAYTPYGPNGVGGLFLALVRLRRRLPQAKRSSPNA